MHRQPEPWNQVLADATAPDHIVQLYQDQDFLSRAVCRFAGAGLANGEGFILASTLTHWNAWRMLPKLGTNHSHLIPVEDYARLGRAVADALREAVGAAEADVLEDRLLSEYREAFDMPRAEALLLALRQVRPAVADPVLQRAGELYAASGVP
jgi:hypothetical protein